MSKFEQAALSSLACKNGARILPVIEDMKRMGDAVLVVNLACDDDYAQINKYIAAQYSGIIADGINSLAEAGGCREAIIYGGEIDTGKIAGAVGNQTGIPIKVLSGPASSVLRDETALFSVIDSGVIRVNRAEQEYYGSFPSYGYRGRPTLVVDGETAYQAGRLFNDPDTPLTKIVSVISGGAELKTEIKEVLTGCVAAELLKGYVVNSPVLVGGVCGSFVNAETLNNTRIAFRYEYDSIRIFNDGDCVINELAGLYQKIQELSCAKCVLCREGSWQLSAIFADITAGRSNRDDIALIEDICPIINAGALCSFGKGMVMPALTAAIECREELEKHVIGRTCPAGRCHGLIKYIVDPSLCIGCGDCVDECPEEAIEGRDGFIHIIDEKLCEKCGKCVSTCTVQAIKTDAGVIRTPRKPVRVGRFI